MSKEYVYEVTPIVKQYIHIVADSKEEADAKLKNGKFNSIDNSGITNLTTKECISSAKFLRESNIKRTYVFSIEKSQVSQLSVVARSIEEAIECIKESDAYDIEDLEEESNSTLYNKDTLKFLYAR